MELIASFSLIGNGGSEDVFICSDLGKAKRDNIIATTGILRLSKFKSLNFTSAAVQLIEFAASRFLPAPTHLVTCTQTPDRVMPSPSFDIVNDMDGPCDLKCMDIKAGCTGFVDCAMLSQAFIAAYDRAVVYCITGDISTRIVDPMDHATACVFGDAVNLSIFQASSLPGNESTNYDFESFVATRFRDAIHLEREYLVMDGLAVLTFVMQSVVPMLKNYIKRIADLEDLSSFSLILHQANKFIVDLVNKSVLKEFPSIVVHSFCLEDVGNSSSSTIPLAISRLFEKNLCQTKKIVVCGFGVGMATHIGVIEVESLVTCVMCEGNLQHGDVA